MTCSLGHTDTKVDGAHRIAWRLGQRLPSGSLRWLDTNHGWAGWLRALAPPQAWGALWKPVETTFSVPAPGEWLAPFQPAALAGALLTGATWRLPLQWLVVYWSGGMGKARPGKPPGRALHTAPLRRRDRFVSVNFYVTLGRQAIPKEGLADTPFRDVRGGAPCLQGHAPHFLKEVPFPCSTLFPAPLRLLTQAAPS